VWSGLFGLNNNWEQGGNWAVQGDNTRLGDYPGWNSTTQTATTNDVAVFRASNAALTMTQAHELAQLQVQAAFGGTINLNANLTLNNGGSFAGGTIINSTATIQGAINLTGGQFTWVGGSINVKNGVNTTAGTFTISSGATAIFGSAISDTLSLGDNVTVELGGTLQLANARAAIRYYNSIAVDNVGDIVVTVNGSGWLRGLGSAPLRIDNNGQFTMSVRGGTYRFDNAWLNQGFAGTLQITNSTLQFTGADPQSGYSVVNTDGTVELRSGHLGSPSGYHQTGIGLAQLNMPSSGASDISNQVVIDGGSVNLGDPRTTFLSLGLITINAGTLSFTYDQDAQRGFGQGSRMNAISNIAINAQSTSIQVTFVGTRRLPPSLLLMMSVRGQVSVAGNIQNLSRVPNYTANLLTIAGEVRPRYLRLVRQNNMPPQVQNTQMSGPKNQRFIVAAPGVLAPDSDPDGDPLLVSAVNGDPLAVGQEITLSSGATLLLNDDGSFTYTPPAGYVGQDGFTYTLTDTLTTVDASVTINVTDTSLDDTSSGISLATSLNPSQYAQSVTLTATVTPGGGLSGTPTGQVDFYDNGSYLDSASLNNGVAALTVDSLGLGAHNITAVYPGDSVFGPGSSSPLTQSVNDNAVDISLTPSVDPIQYTQPVTFTATVTSTYGLSGTPTGQVDFYDGSSYLGSATLNNGVASLTVSSLAVGDHSITATYEGDNTYQGNSSYVLTQTVNANDTTVSLSSSQAQSQYGQAVTFTAVITLGSDAVSGTPTGLVDFYSDGVYIGSGTLSSGVASFTISTLSVGTHTITAVYEGDSVYNGSTSDPLTQQVANNDNG
jgi:hypothetical protein